MGLAAVSQAEHYKSLSDGSVQANAAGIDLNFKFELGWGRKKSVNQADQAVQSMKSQALETVEIVPDIVASAIATVEAVRLQ